MCALFARWPFLLLSGAALIADFLLTGHPAAGEAPIVRPIPPVVLTLVICGLPLLAEAAVSLFVHRRIQTCLLIATAMIACLATGQLFAAGEVAFIMALGEAIEAATLKRARRGLGTLLSLAPPTARFVITCPKCLAKGERFRQVPVETLAVGDLVRVLPGETIPVDGIITEGVTSIDESALTGEPLPVDRSPGDPVRSGAINRFGALTVRVTARAADSSIQKLIRLMDEARRRKAPIQRIADRWASILVPAALALALATFLAVWAATGTPATALQRAVTILVVFCPCALALATPTAIMAAIAQAAKNGVIVKSGEALECMGRVTTVCFDKTGTLTAGRPAVTALHPSPGVSADDLLRLAAAVESSSEHPLARAIVTAAGDRPEPLRSIRDVSATPGRGARGTVDGRTVLCGSAGYLAENGVRTEAAAQTAVARKRREGAAAVFVAIDRTPAGAIVLQDTLRPSAAPAVAALKADGIDTWLLSGDHRDAAAVMAGRLGLATVHAQLLPTQKADIVARLQNDGRLVCMVGDGINDALALKTAAVGVAMGGDGSDIAVEAADIALVGGDLMRLVYLRRLATACVRLIRANIAFSLALNTVAVLCSILGLLTPVTGALVHNAGSVLVVLNAALLYERRFLTRTSAP
jgi:heavy metal translocating P-type ATPase